MSLLLCYAVTALLCYSVFNILITMEGNNWCWTTVQSLEFCWADILMLMLNGPEMSTAIYLLLCYAMSLSLCYCITLLLCVTLIPMEENNWCRMTCYWPYSILEVGHSTTVQSLELCYWYSDADTLWTRTVQGYLLLCYTMSLLLRYSVTVSLLPIGNSCLMPSWNTDTTYHYLGNWNINYNQDN